MARGNSGDRGAAMRRVRRKDIMKTSAPADYGGNEDPGEGGSADATGPSLETSFEHER